MSWVQSHSNDSFPENFLSTFFRNEMVVIVRGGRGGGRGGEGGGVRLIFKHFVSTPQGTLSPPISTCWVDLHTIYITGMCCHIDTHHSKYIHMCILHACILYKYIRAYLCSIFSTNIILCTIQIGTWCTTCM